jgi:lycopene cyclase domain-containing protein
MEKFGYVAMLLFTLFGSIWLEVALKVRVIKRLRRVILSILPTAFAFLIWDAYAIHSGHWYFDAKQILGIFGPLGIPLEEVIFFVIVPLAAILTIEAVRTVKKNWLVGDEK